jgi:hypothetical protein
VECLRASGGESGGEVGGEKCVVALVGVGTAESGAAEAVSTLGDPSLISFCSFSSIRTFACVGSGSAMFGVWLVAACASECGELGV